MTRIGIILLTASLALTGLFSMQLRGDLAAERAEVKRLRDVIAGPQREWGSRPAVQPGDSLFTAYNTTEVARLSADGVLRWTCGQSDGQPVTCAEEVGAISAASARSWQRSVWRDCISGRTAGVLHEIKPLRVRGENLLAP